MFRRIFRHIKEGFIGVGRHFGMAISSSASVTITLLLVGFFLVVVYNLNLITKDIESSISLSVLVDYDVTNEASIETIKQQIQSIKGVKSVEYKSKDKVDSQKTIEAINKLLSNE